MKRVLVVSDFHSGHLVGLTPPAYDTDKKPAVKPRSWEKRRAVWKWYESTLKKLRPIHVLIANGDLIDGKAPETGASELLYADLDDQVEMAVQAIKLAQAQKIFMSYGTAYHTGKAEDWENQIARQVDAVKIGSEDTVVVNGTIINYKHHIGRSAVPHGRHTAIARDVLWNMIWAERGEYPKADIIIRSHVHYYNYCGGSDWLGFTTPALQGYGTKYGRRVSGTVDVGMVLLDIDDRGIYKCEPKLLRFPLQAPISA